MKFLKWLKSLFTKKSSGGMSGGGAPVQQQKPVETPKQFFLSWDSNSERHAWTDWLLKYFSDKEVLSVFDSASDITNVIPQWKTLSDEMKSYFLSEFICRLAYYECGWNPKDSSVDVGTQGDKDTWSVGLLQMSVVDQKSYKLSFGFNYSDLQDPIKNMTLGLEIMKIQIKRKGKILIVKPEKGAYWSTLNPGNTHDKSDKIISDVKKWCAKEQTSQPIQVPTDEKPDWYRMAESFLGVNETKDPETVILFHSAASLDKRDWKTTTSWCASFWTFIFKKLGYKNTGGAWARDYLNVGTKLDTPKNYCIMVFERNAPGGDSHVTCWTGKEDADYFYCLGGNQSDSVKISGYKKNALLGCRWPEKL